MEAKMSNKTNGMENISKEYEKSREVSQKTKKLILMSWGIFFALLIVFWGISYVLSKIDENINKSPIYDPNAQTIIFHEINYNEDIFKDSVYMGLDRNIYIYDLNTGVMESLEEHDYTNYGKDVKFMADFINYIILGNAEGYNDCFDEDYYTDIDNEPKESYTMQKLYNIKLTKISEENIDSGEYTEYVYYLEYMIYQNNGSFRMDIGSDASVAQYITVSDKYGDLKISELIRSYYQ